MRKTTCGAFCLAMLFANLSYGLIAHEFRFSVAIDRRPERTISGHVYSNTDGAMRIHLFWEEPAECNYDLLDYFSCSDFLIKENSVHAWFAYDGEGQRSFSFPLGELSSGNASDLQSYLQDILSVAAGVQGAEKAESNRPILWPDSVLNKLSAGESFLHEIAPLSISARPPQGDPGAPALRFPPYGRTYDYEPANLSGDETVFQLTQAQDGKTISRLWVRPLQLPDQLSENYFESSDVGNLTEAPAHFRDYWELRYRYADLQTAQAPPAAYRDLLGALLRFQKMELPDSLKIMTSYLVGCCAFQVGDNGQFQSAFATYLRSASRTPYRHRAVYLTGATLKEAKFHLDEKAHSKATTAFARILVGEGMLGNIKSIQNYLGDYMMNSWHQLASSVMDDLVAQGHDPALFDGYRNKISAGFAKN